MSDYYSGKRHLLISLKSQKRSELEKHFLDDEIAKLEKMAENLKD